MRSELLRPNVLWKEKGKRQRKGLKRNLVHLSDGTSLLLAEKTASFERKLHILETLYAFADVKLYSRNE